MIDRSLLECHDGISFSFSAILFNLGGRVRGQCRNRPGNQGRMQFIPNKFLKKLCPICGSGSEQGLGVSKLLGLKCKTFCLSESGFYENLF